MFKCKKCESGNYKLIEKAANREILELKRKQFEKAKAEFDITNMCICASIIEKLENEIKGSE